MELEYSLVLLEGAPSAIDGESGAPLDPTAIIITIEAPIFPGGFNLPSRIKVVLNPNATQTIGLLRSDLISPRGKYRVSYSRADKPKEVVRTEEWIVGANPQRSYLAFELNGALSYQLPQGVPSKFDLQPQTGFSLPEYSAIGRTLSFATAPLAQTALLSYQLPLTRSEVLYSPNVKRYCESKREPLLMDEFVTYIV